jgi:tetratricopeptide (TPR) repeat protein
MGFSRIKNYVGITSVLLMIGCGKKPEPLELIEFQVDTAQLKVETSASIDTLVDFATADSVPVQPMKTDTAKTMVTLVATSIDSVKPKVVKRSLNRVNAVKAVTTAAEPLQINRSPKTSEEARQWSKEHYKEAQGLLQLGKAREALEHIEEAIPLYENGSLFILKARCLISMGKEVAAITAADRAIAKAEFWEPESRTTALKEKVKALEKANQKTPSRIIREELDETRSLIQ